MNIWAWLSTLTMFILMYSDPKRIMLERSNNSNGEAGSSKSTRINLHDFDQRSGLSFSGWNEAETFVFTNDLNSNHCAVTFVQKPDASKLQVGSYKMFQYYAKEWSSLLLEKLISKKVPAQKTFAHVGVPTTMPIIYPTSPWFFQSMMNKFWFLDSTHFHTF